MNKVLVLFFLIFFGCATKNSEYSDFQKMIANLQVESNNSVCPSYPNKYSQDIHYRLSKFCVPKFLVNNPTSLQKTSLKVLNNEKLYYIPNLGYIVSAIEYIQDKSGTYSTDYRILFNKDLSKPKKIGVGAIVGPYP